MVDQIILNRLAQRFGRENVFPEWDVAKNSEDTYTRQLYCPRIDFAVGPFNINADLGANNTRITREYNKHRNFFETLRKHSISITDFKTNDNPRCFVAIEVENSGSRKHRIGSIVNASAIGKVGILLAKDQKNLRILRKAKDYLDFIQRVGKTQYSPKNVIIILYDDFVSLL